MSLSEYLVIGAVGLIFMAGVSHVVRSRGGARAERRFWIRFILMLTGVSAASLLALWLLPERYQTFASAMISGVSFVAVLYMFRRYEQPSASYEGSSGKS